MRWLRNILALAPCGKPQASHFAHVTGLLQWLPGRLNFTNLEHYGGRSARTHARWFARPFPFARLAVAALGALPPQVPEGLGELLAMDASFVAKSGDQTWGTGWFGSGMARAARWGLEVTLLAAVDVAEGGAYPLCARQSPGTVRSRRQACGADTGRETALDAALALLGEAVAAGAKETLGTRWVAVDGGYARRPFVEGVRQLDLHTVGRLRKDAVLRFPYLGSHERRPGRKRQFDGCFDRRHPARMARTPLKKAKVDLYHAVLHAKAWPCWLQVVYVLPRGADPETKEGVLLYSTDLDLAPERIFRFYGARFQIEFAFRDAKQHLGLNDGQARSQARQHFHFNLVFAALFWARLQARLQAERPLGPFSLRHRKRHKLEEEIHKRIAARSATGRNAPNAGAGRCRIPPERLWLRAPPPETGPAGP
ncbi:MAG: transposase [Caldilineaceae bacterium SB0661_bin_34]|nr:transposase [Caldilineaceae bacterium SB0661_bin_34]